MTIRIPPSVVLLAAGLALSGCIDIECPAEFARPTARERFCGHTGDYGSPVTYKVYGQPAPVAMPVVTTTTTTTTMAPPPPSAAPAPPVTVQPVPPPGGGPTQIR